MPNTIDPATIEKAKEEVFQWMIFQAGTTGPVLPAKAFSEDLVNKYALKNTKINQFLRYAHQTFGINLDKTSQQIERWIFTRCNDNTEPIKYGETIAIGTGGQPTWINFEVRTYGINLKFKNDPSCEWRIIGGPIGTPVKTGDRVGLFNEKSKASPTENGEFLIHFDRTLGHADLGWPTSQTLLDNLGDFFKDNWEDIVKYLLGEGTQQDPQPEEMPRHDTTPGHGTTRPPVNNPS
ncbi:MAG: hypothetical protein HY868_03260 [Chloroflexi bacterium]|nr:hypothetical protein [Chloroflexota bacterium]